MRNELQEVVETISEELEAVYTVIQLSKERKINIAAAPIKEGYAVDVVVASLQKAGYGVTVESHLTGCFGDAYTYVVITW